MANALQGRRIAILAADGVERVELEVPRDEVLRAGAQTDLLSLRTGQIQACNNDLEEAGTFDVNRAVSDASVSDYDALLLPGSTVNPDKLRIDERAVAFVRDFVRSGKPVGVICHGPWTLIEAGVADGNLISSRSPDDLSAFCRAIVEQLPRRRRMLLNNRREGGGIRRSPASAIRQNQAHGSAPRRSASSKNSQTRPPQAQCGGKEIPRDVFTTLAPGPSLRGRPSRFVLLCCWVPPRVGSEHVGQIQLQGLE